MRWLNACLLGLLAVACSTATRVDYTHEPTADLQDSYEISRSAYDPFRRSGVVVYPCFKLTERTKQMVVVRVVSASKQSVHLTECSVAGKELPVDQVIELDEVAKPGVFRGAHVVAKIEGTELEALNGGGDFEMEVRFTVGDRKKLEELTFDISRVQTTQFVTH